MKLALHPTHTHTHKRRLLRFLASLPASVCANLMMIKKANVFQDVVTNCCLLSPPANDDGVLFSNPKLKWVKKNTSKLVKSVVNVKENNTKTVGQNSANYFIPQVDHHYNTTPSSSSHDVTHINPRRKVRCSLLIGLLLCHSTLQQLTTDSTPVL